MTATNDDGAEYIYRRSITTRSGKRIFAESYGLRAFRIKVRKAKKDRPSDGRGTDADERDGQNR